MDNALIYVAMIAAILVLAIFLPRWVRRSTDAAGGREGRRYATTRLTGILDELDLSLIHI